MEKIKKKIQVEFEKLENQNEDDKFFRVKCWICNIGENHNASFFSKVTLQEMAKTLPNIPVTGFIGKNKFDEIDFRGHEELLVKLDNGEYEFKYLGFAYGIVPESTSNHKFESKLCPDGVERTYLTTEILIWKKWQDVIDIFERDDWEKSQSMELTDVEGYIDKEDKLFHFTSAKFDGLCILGKDVEPAIPYSNIQTFNKQMIEFMSDYHDYIKFSYNELIEGGERMKSTVNKKEIAAKFSLTVNQLYTELDRALSTITYISENYYGEPIERSKFYIGDYDETYCYAYDCELRMDMKIPYVMNGDNPEIDIENASRIKYVPSDWVDETEGSTKDLDELDEFDTYAQKVINEAKVEFTNLKKSFEDKFAIKDDSYLKLTEKFELLQEESIKFEDSIKSLQQYKDENESAKNKVEVETLFTKYSKHLSKEEMEDLRESYKNFTKFSDYVNHFNSIVVSKLITEEKPNFSRMSLNLEAVEEEDTIKSTSAYKKVKNKKY